MRSDPDPPPSDFSYFPSSSDSENKRKKSKDKKKHRKHRKDDLSDPSSSDDSNESDDSSFLCLRRFFFFLLFFALRADSDDDDESDESDGGGLGSEFTFGPCFAHFDVELCSDLIISIRVGISSIFLRSSIFSFSVRLFESYLVDSQFLSYFPTLYDLALTFYSFKIQFLKIFAKR